MRSNRKLLIHHEAKLLSGLVKNRRLVKNRSPLFSSCGVWFGWGRAEEGAKAGVAVAANDVPLRLSLQVRAPTGAARAHVSCSCWRVLADTSASYFMVGLGRI